MAETEKQETTGFDYFECPECGFSSVQSADFRVCAGDSGHDVRMRRRPATADDSPEGFDARKGTRQEQEAARAG